MKDRNPSQREILNETKFLEEYVRELWTFLPLPICYVNPIHKILNINTAFLDLSGYSYNEAIGMSALALFSGAQAGEGFFKEALEKESVSGRELELVSRDGSRTVPVRAYSQRRTEEEGRVIGYFLGVVDMTAEKQFREELEKRVLEKTEELHEKVEELEQFRRLAVGRELKMIELKQKLEEFRKKPL